MLHEDLSRDERAAGSSERGFGVVFAIVFLIVAAWPLTHGQGLRFWALVVAAAFATVALVVPRWLALPNRLWMQLGLLLAKVVSPVALGLLYYGVFLPVGLAMRVFGMDSLRLKRDRAATTYWIARDPPGPPAQSMTQQF
jgi:hypothetical protein